MSVQIAVVYEANADFEIATGLADRVLVDRLDWLDDELIQHSRQWLGESTSGVALTWASIKLLARDAGISAMGHFDGNPAMPDAQAARRAILYLLRTFDALKGIMLVRDQDDQSARRRGLEQACNEHPAIPIVVGLAVVERECWVLSGFEPADDAETKRLETERQSLGFDPRVKSHELTACKNNSAPHSAKRVLRQLTVGDAERERHCWCRADLATLIARGKHNGLAEFLFQIDQKFTSFFGHAK